MRRFLVHFDVAEDYVLLDTFLGSALATQKAISVLNDELFNDSIAFELVVFPPEGGTLKQYIGVSVRAVGYTYIGLWSLIQLMDSQTVQEVSKEIFGAVPSAFVVEGIQSLKSRASELQRDDTEKIELLNREGQKLIEDLVVNAAQSSLSMPRAQLEEAAIPDELIYGLAEAQSQLFSSALRDQEVRGIGFSEGDDFPIPRSEFLKRAIPPRRKEKEDDTGTWHVSFENIHVTSPNFDQKDQARRRWKGRLANSIPVLFEIHDAEFWIKLRSGEIEFSDTTCLYVQLARKIISGQVRELYALRVLMVDGFHVRDALSESELKATLEAIERSEGRTKSRGLFDD